MKTQYENSVDDCEATEAENRALVQNMHDRLHNLVKENEELKLAIDTKNKLGLSYAKLRPASLLRLLLLENLELCKCEK